MDKVRISIVIRVTAIIVVFVLGAAAGAYHYFARDLPGTARLEGFEPSLKTQVFADDGSLIGELYQQNRVLIPLDEIPPYLVDALIAVEDRKFYSHWGVDVFGIARATISNLRAGEVVSGASTISQQLARNLFTMFDVSLSRKIKEAILALKIEKTYSKDEILEMYLNQIYFGSGAYGVEAASREFFGKSVRDISVAEATLLVGLAKNPRDYSPHYHLDRLIVRRKTVLRAMVATGRLTPADVDSIEATPIVIAGEETRGPYGAYFLEHVRRYLEQKYGADRIYHDGLQVYTTLDPYLQRVAEDSMATHMALIEQEREYEQTLESYQAAVDSGNATGLPEYIQSAAIAIEPRSGYIRVMVGGRNFRHSSFNRSVQAKRQPGSAFKPFVYLTALENGYTPADIILDAPIVLDLPNGDVWKPHNFSKKFEGEISMRYALNKSINVAAVRVLLSLGPVSVISNSHKLGIKSDLQNVYSLALGTSEVDLLELTSAYATMAAGGIRAEPLAIKMIRDRNGKVLEENAVYREEVLSPQTAFMITNMMESVINGGTGRGSRLMGFVEPAAGKTGTTDEYTDGWFIGYTPELAVGVWTGFDRKRTMGGRMTGAKASLPTWTHIINAHYRDHSGDQFAAPEGIIHRVVCETSGAIATSKCSQVRREVFIEGTEPRSPCERHGAGIEGAGLDSFESLDGESWNDR
jgi:penicillin-binding protein 1A